MTQIRLPVQTPEDLLRVFVSFSGHLLFHGSLRNKRLFPDHLQRMNTEPLLPLYVKYSGSITYLQIFILKNLEFLPYIAITNQLVTLSITKASTNGPSILSLTVMSFVKRFRKAFFIFSLSEPMSNWLMSSPNFHTASASNTSYPSLDWSIYTVQLEGRVLRILRFS